MSVQVEVRAVVNRKIEKFERTLPDTLRPTLETLLDVFEGQVGTVMSVTMDNGRIYLFKSMAEPHEAGVV